MTLVFTFLFKNSEETTAEDQLIAKEDEDKKTDGKQILSFCFSLYLALL